MPTSDTTSPSLKAKAKAGSGIRWASSRNAASRFMAQISATNAVIVPQTAVCSCVLTLK
jgi:hypothetical protein